MNLDNFFAMVCIGFYGGCGLHPLKKVFGKIAHHLLYA
jgi:hypothetical protein